PHGERRHRRRHDERNHQQPEPVKPSAELLILGLKSGYLRSVNVSHEDTSRSPPIAPRRVSSFKRHRSRGLPCRPLGAVYAQHPFQGRPWHQDALPDPNAGNRSGPHALISNTSGNPQQGRGFIDGNGQSLGHSLLSECRGTLTPILPSSSFVTV